MCGTAGALCFEKDGASKSVNWAFVGEGRGGYEKVQTFTYVGDRAGSFDKEQVITYSGWRCRWCCIIWLLLLILGVGGFLLYFFLVPTSSIKSKPSIDIPVRSNFTVTSLLFDCDAGYWNWEKGWSVEKQHWCCDRYEKACPDEKPTAPYNCNEAFMNWETAWPIAKRHYCCETEGRGCPVVTTSLPYNCHTGILGAWSRGKKMWCCHNYDIGCAPPPTTQPYDCLAGLSDWEDGWSGPKKRWCCGHFNLGCHHPTAAPVQSYDCDVGFSNWQALWSPQKKTWCCTRHNRGCHVIIRTLPYDCDAGFRNWQAGWSEAKKFWCCNRVHRGCHVSLPYDCNAGYNNWQRGWSPAKKTWCCSRVNKGCQVVEVEEHAEHAEHEEQALVVHELYDCNADFSHRQHMWSHAQKQWCCDHYNKGCPSTTLSPLGCATPCTLGGLTAICHDRIQYVATHTFAHLENACGQAYSKVQVECPICRACSIEAASCQELSVTIYLPPPAPEPVRVSYDCNAGLSNFHIGWSEPKKTWCCNNHGQGCEGPNPPAFAAGAGFRWKRVMQNGFWTWIRIVWHERTVVTTIFDCDAGYANWEAGWSPAKKTWCCQHHKKGCFHLPGRWFDCNAGLSNFHTWPQSQKTWCCSKQGKSCEGPNPPSFPAGAGFMWKHVMENGFWTWSRVHIGGAMNGVQVVHSVHVYGNGGEALVHGFPPGPAGAGYVWKWYNGAWHQQRFAGSMPFDCDAALNNFRAAWSEPKKKWCCMYEDKGCA